MCCVLVYLAMIRMSLGTKTSVGSIYFEGLFNPPCLNRPLKIECIIAPPLRESIHPLLPKNVFLIRYHGLLLADFFEMNEKRLRHEHRWWPLPVRPLMSLMKTSPRLLRSRAACGGLQVPDAPSRFPDCASQEPSNISFCTLSINYLLSASFMAVGNTN